MGLAQLIATWDWSLVLAGAAFAVIGAVLAVTQIAVTGVTFTLTAAAGGGDSFLNTGREFFALANGGGGSINVTFSSNGAGAVCNFGVTNTAHDVVVTVSNGVTKLIGPFPTNRFNDSNGRVQVTYSGVTSVTVNPFACPAAA